MGDTHLNRQLFNSANFNEIDLTAELSQVLSFFGAASTTAEGELVDKAREYVLFKDYERCKSLHEPLVQTLRGKAPKGFYFGTKSLKDKSWGFWPESERLPDSRLRGAEEKGAYEPQRKRKHSPT